jgi:hypothetical protein
VARGAVGRKCFTTRRFVDFIIPTPSRQWRDAAMARATHDFSYPCHAVLDVCAASFFLHDDTSSIILESLQSAQFALQGTRPNIPLRFMG